MENVSKSKINVKKMTIAALLCAIGILIPIVMPLKIIIPPASFTLASHVAIFVAMFISPGTALFVACGTTAGFFIAGFPIVIVARAFSHILFALLGSLYLKNHRELLKNWVGALFFAFIISLIHGASEIVAVMPFYFGGKLSDAVYNSGFLVYVLGLTGVGTVAHSMIDFILALLVWRAIPKKMTASLIDN